MYQKQKTIWSVLLAGVLALSLLLGGCGVDDVSTTTQSTSPTVQTTQPDTQPETTAPTLPQDSELQVRFLDVGQADAALVSCDGHHMLIDGGNRGDSNLIYSVLQREEISYLDMVVATHAHEDHIGGLPGAFQYASAGLTLSPVTAYDSDVFETFAAKAQEKGGGLTVPQPGDTYPLGSAIVTILGVNGAEDTNNTSIVLRIDYGETAFLFTGDAEREAEQVILDSGLPLGATVLKVGHHGSDTSTTYPFLREIMPQYAVISVGTGNSYGHPCEDTLSRLRDADVEVFRTDMQGDIVCTSDGKTVTVQPQRNQDADTLGPATPTEPPETQPEEETQAPSQEWIQVLAWPERVGRKETATVTIQALPNTTYSITVNYKSGPSSAKGLEDKTSDGSGQVSWSWKVGGRTSPGTFHITISGGGETLTLPFTVTE